MTSLLPRALLAIAALATCVMAAALLPGVRPDGGAVPAIDDGVQIVGYVAAALAAAWLAATAPRDRGLWWLVASALALRAYGFVHTILLLHRSPVYPSLADAAWIASTLLLLAAVLVAAHRVVEPHGVGVLGLDALLAGLTAIAVATTLLDSTIDELTRDALPTDVVLTNLVYPMLDVAVVGVLAGIVVLERWRVSADTVVLATGMTVLAVVDGWFLYLVAHGGFRQGSLLAPLSLGATTLIAAAAAVPARPVGRRPPRHTSLVPPVALALVCLGILTYDSIGTVSDLGSLAAASGIVVAIARSIVTLSSDRRASQAVIAEKDEELLQFRALVEASRDFIALGTMQGRVRYLNPAARHMVGIPPEAPLPDMTIGEMLTPEAARHQMEVERPAIMATGSWRGESTLRHREGGEPVPVFKNTFIVRHDDGSPWLLGTIQRDITDLRAAQAGLERFRALVEASSDFIALAEIDGTVRYVNPAGRRMVGLADHADVEQTSISDYLTEEGLRRSVEVEQPAVIAQGRWQGESTLRDLRGGDPIPVTINSFLIRHPATDQPWLLATVQRDITDLVAARDQLQRLADDRQLLLRHLVEAQEAERSRIAADVHDDPVQVMAAVDLQLGLAQRQLDMGVDATEVAASLAEMRGTVAQANDRLRYLLFDLDSPAQREDVGTALAEAAAYVLGESVRAEVRCEPGLQLDETVRVLVYRIAKEAMVNVRKHARASRVDLRVRRVEDGVEVTVADDGVGIPVEEPSPRPGHRGLSDMRDRAAIAGGSVTVTPGAAGGTVVRLWIPVSANGD